jgi:hypothetical protein
MGDLLLHRLSLAGRNILFFLGRESQGMTIDGGSMLVSEIFQFGRGGGYGRGGYGHRGYGHRSYGHRSYGGYHRMGYGGSHRMGSYGGRY